MPMNWISEKINSYTLKSTGGTAKNLARKVHLQQITQVYFSKFLLAFSLFCSYRLIKRNDRHVVGQVIL